MRWFKVLVMAGFMAGGLAVFAQTSDVDSLLSSIVAETNNSGAAPASGATPPVAAAPIETPKAPEVAPPTAVAAPVAPAAETKAPEIAAPAVTTEAAPVVAEKAEVSPAALAEQAKVKAEQEQIRRQALEVEGLKALQAGDDALREKKYDEARKQFETALARLPERKENADKRELAKAGLAEALYGAAYAIYDSDNGDLNTASEYLSTGMKYSQERKFASLKSRIDAKIEKMGRQPKVDPVDVKSITSKDAEIAALLAKGRKLYNLGEYEKADAVYQQALVKDPYNVNAVRARREVANKLYKIDTSRLDTKSVQAMEDVRSKWNPPTDERVTQVIEKLPGGIDPQREVMEKKLKSIVLPVFNVEAANIDAVVKYLQVESAKVSDGGVNLVLSLKTGATGSAAPALGEAAPAEGAAAPASATDIPPITLDLRNVTLLDALKIVTEVSKLKYTIRGNMVFITRMDYEWGSIETRVFNVPPTVISAISAAPAPAADTTGFGAPIAPSGGGTAGGDVRRFFENAGVNFPAGSMIQYNQTAGKLIVANTEGNLEKVRMILEALNEYPKQIEIEARFVEINQSELEELGFEWILTDNWELMTKKSGAPLAGQERMVMNADPQGLTKGNRDWVGAGTVGALPMSSVTRGVNPVLGSIASFSSILTNPQLNMVLHALSQKGATDLLSAPKVTTVNGQTAKIMVVREIRYPQSYEIKEQNITYSGLGGAAPIPAPPSVQPNEFTARDTGVILEVTPNYNKDNDSISMTLTPEVTELTDWLDYGFTWEAGGSSTYLPMRQPVFTSRKATTQLVIWDGATVVLGGLIREDLITFKDKVPLLGDIPLIGRLFRNEGSYSVKKNLLIFVTAQLVKPNGMPERSDRPVVVPSVAPPVQTVATPAP